MQAVADVGVLKMRPERQKAVKGCLRYTRIRFGIFLSGLSVFAQLYLFQPMLTLLCKQFNITPAHSSLAVSACTVGMATGLFLFAFKADRFPRKKLMVSSMIISTILTIISATVSNFELLIAINFLKGMVLSGVSAVALAYLSEEVDAGSLGTSISLYLAGNTMGGMMGRVGATLMSGWWGWQWATVGIGVGSLLLGLVFAEVFPESRHFAPAKVETRRKLEHMGQFLRDPLIVRLYFVAALIMGAFVSVYNYLGFRLEAAPFSLPHYLIAFIFLMYTTGVAGSLVTGKWSDRHPADKILRVFMLLLVPGLLFLLTKSVGLIIIGLGIFTFAFFGAHTMASKMVSQQAKQGKSTATSLYWLFYYLGSSLVGSSTGIALQKWNWEVFIGVLFLLVLGSLLLVKPKK
ncbi:MULTISPECIES: MFS transporter [unclassified Chitinophaga]|uniref:MFS transporter n=1 Tax=unclassified Chitinophaga TaxID=2619133 RepID=UPI001F16CDFF|nr:MULTISPECIES: MFS transporter [unclassified Chitinophaga]WPV65315.1 MFS transporter [Chitinophaga sp. LS1]